MEEHLEKQIPKFFFQMFIASAGVDIEMVDGFKEFVGLFKEMTTKRLMGLLAVPRTLGAQYRDEFRETNQLLGDRGREFRKKNRGEMVGRYSIDFCPRNFFDDFIR